MLRAEWLREQVLDTGALVTWLQQHVTSGRRGRAQNKGRAQGPPPSTS